MTVKRLQLSLHQHMLLANLMIMIKFQVPLTTRLISSRLLLPSQQQEQPRALKPVRLLSVSRLVGFFALVGASLSAPSDSKCANSCDSHSTNEAQADKDEDAFLSANEAIAAAVSRRISEQSSANLISETEASTIKTVAVHGADELNDDAEVLRCINDKIEELTIEQQTKIDCHNGTNHSVLAKAGKNDPLMCKRLMIVSSRTPDIEDFCTMCLPSVTVIRYNFDDSCEQWMKIVAASKETLHSGEDKFKTVALANHGPPGDNWDILSTVGMDVPSGKKDPGFDDMFALMASLAADRVDLLACALAATDAGVRFVEETETKLCVNFAASDDVTGNAASGGDWVLETDNINVKALYFEESLMEAFDGSFLLKQLTLKSVPIFESCEDGFISLVAEKVLMADYREGHVFTQIGEEGDHMWILHKGKIQQKDAKGEIVVREAVGDELTPAFGGLALMEEGPRRFEFKALTDVNASVLSRADLRTCFESFPSAEATMWTAVMNKYHLPSGDPPSQIRAVTKPAPAAASLSNDSEAAAIKPESAHAACQLNDNDPVSDDAINQEQNDVAKSAAGAATSSEASERTLVNAEPVPTAANSSQLRMRPCPSRGTMKIPSCLLQIGVLHHSQRQTLMHLLLPI
jgi:hypothetical protein